MISPSSAVSYPQSSSPPAQLAGRKRAAHSDVPPDFRKRLIKRGTPLSLRDSNRPADRDVGKYDPSPELLAQILLKPKRQGPFIDDENLDGSSSDYPLPVYEYDRSPAINLLSKSSTVKPSSLGKRLQATTACGRTIRLKEKRPCAQKSYERLIAERSSAESGKATKSYYGIEIHNLLEKVTEASDTISQDSQTDDVFKPSNQIPSLIEGARRGRTLMWTEKYRAKKFTDLVGDERTHREVLRWVKDWDPIVFPGSSRPKPKNRPQHDEIEKRPFCKILLLTGPPGLGKTTLAHVCARQAGYETVEINASDDRSRDVVRGKIRDLVGTQNVRGVSTKTVNGTIRKAGRPVCVVVDEVDGVVGGSGGGGEGGFIKALIDLVALDQKNNEMLGKGTQQTSGRQRKKGDRFRLLRPMILICNDVYHPALRPLRSAGVAHIIHVRRAPMDKAVSRLKAVFENEGIPCDSDGVRRLCETTWGVANRMEGRSSLPGSGEGDIRGLLVVGEWVAARLRSQQSSSATSTIRLTKQWIQQHVLQDLGLKGSASRNLGRGGAKEAVERIFQDNAGFAKEPISMLTMDSPLSKSAQSFGVSEAGKRVAMERLRDLVEASGECDRITTDCFTNYAFQPFQDDTLLTKPNAAYDWLHFHDSLSARIFSGQEWELSPYLSQSALGFHNLFASAPKHAWATHQGRWENEDKEELLPFTGPRADYESSETQKQSKAVLEAFRSSLSLPLLRSFSSGQVAAPDLLPYLIRILSPNVKPVIVGGSGEQRGIVSVRRKEEREMIERAVRVLSDVGLSFERSRVEMTKGSGSNYVYRMEPPVDTLTSFETATADISAASATRYAVRQALDQEHQKLLVSRRAGAGQARLGGRGTIDHIANASKSGRKGSVQGKGKGSATGVKRDFFGRVIQESANDMELTEGAGQEGCPKDPAPGKESKGKVFVSFHEGYSNAVRKPITLDDLIRGL